MVSNIATNMREGIFEKAYEEEMHGQAKQVLAQPAGKKCFEDGAIAARRVGAGRRATRGKRTSRSRRRGCSKREQGQRRRRTFYM